VRRVPRKRRPQRTHQVQAVRHATDDQAGHRHLPQTHPAGTSIQAAIRLHEGLKQVGFTVGWCFIVSAILLMVRDCLAYIGFDRALIGALLILGIILILLGWLKVTQQAQYVLRFSKENREGNNRSGTSPGHD